MHKNQPYLDSTAEISVAIWNYLNIKFKEARMLDQLCSSVSQVFWKSPLILLLFT